jgi:hypothetical protein
VVVCVLSRHKNPPFLCDAEYEWTEHVQHVKIKILENKNITGKSRQKWKIADI